MLSRVFVVGLVLLAGVGCGSTPQYTADRSAGTAASEVVTLVVDPSIRLVSIDGQAVDELPVVGVNDMWKNKGTNKRTVRLAPGQHRVVAGIGPIFNRSLGQARTGAGVGAGMGVGGGGAVGVGVVGSGVNSATFRYPGSEVDQEVSFSATPGAVYVLDFASSEADPGWQLRLVPQNAAPGTPNAARLVATRPSQYEGEPYRRYFEE